MGTRLLLGTFTLWLLAGQAFAELTVSQIAKEYSPSVVTIVALDENDQPLSVGSGFFIDTEGTIASNHHVLEGSTRAIVKSVDGQKGEVLEIIKDDPVLDLLVATTTLRNTVPLPLGDSDTVTVGEDIVAIGNPAGFEGTVSRGIVSGIRKVEGRQWIQITAPISPGSSGGPVFNLDGRVIGVATAYIVGAQNLNFAMPVNYLRTLTPIRAKVYSLPKLQLTPKTGHIGGNRMQWWHWALVGSALIGLEILTLGGLGNFYFLFFGIAALVVGVLVWLGLTEPVWLQWVLFAVFGIATLLVLRKPLQKIPTRTKEADLVDSMVGQVATLLEGLPAQAAGKAELHGSTWTVRNAGDTPLVKGQRSQVIRVDGLTLWIQAEQPITEI